MKLITPDDAPSPYSTAPLPRTISIRSMAPSGTAAHCTPDKSTSLTRRPSIKISVFCVPLAPKPRISTVVLAALLPNRSRTLMPACCDRMSGTVFAALLRISSAVITVKPGAAERPFSGKRVAVTTTGGPTGIADRAGSAAFAVGTTEKEAENAATAVAASEVVCFIPFPRVVHARRARINAPEAPWEGIADKTRLLPRARTHKSAYLPAVHQPGSGTPHPRGISIFGTGRSPGS